MEDSRLEIGAVPLPHAIVQNAGSPLRPSSEQSQTVNFEDEDEDEDEHDSPYPQP